MVFLKKNTAYQCKMLVFSDCYCQASVFVFWQLLFISILKTSQAYVSVRLSVNNILFLYLLRN